MKSSPKTLRPKPLLSRLARPAARLLPAALALPLLSACETAIDVPEPEHTPRVALMLVVDNLPATDSVQRESYLGRMPFVSVSQRLYDLTPLQGSNQATLEVRGADGAVVERYRPVSQQQSPGYPYNYGSGQYRPTLRYQYQPGQAYSVRVTVPGIEVAESQLTMPTPVPVQATLTPLSSTDIYQSRARLTVSFTDPAAAGDYYLASAQLVDAAGRRASYLNYEDETSGSGVDVTPAYRLSEGGSWYAMYPFSDATANGQRISFSTNVTYYDNSGQPGGGPLYLQVTLTHLTRDLYLFYNSYTQYNDNDGNPFAEPTPLYSNIRPGFGVFGGSTDASVRLPL